MKTNSHVAHFEDLAQQRRAAHLGMWTFLASESLLFAGVFGLYAAYRSHYREAFDFGVHHNTKILGSINTLVLLTSSFAIASAVHAVRRAQARKSVLLIAFTIAMGFAFLGIKAIEYARHIHEGIVPGHVPSAMQMPGLTPFFTLYYVATGLHALHVTAGMVVLGWIAVRVARGTALPPHEHVVTLGAMYWHLVDVVWIFLWPLFYLAGTR